MKIEIELDELTIAKAKLLSVGNRKVCGLVFENGEELAVLNGPSVTWFSKSEWINILEEQAQQG